MSRIDLVTWISAPPERCFALSLDVDVHQASAAHTAERAVAGVRTGEMRLGDTVTWEATHFGRRWRLTTTISAYEPPWKFRDEQVRGPFRCLVHDHTFEARDGGTWMRDVFVFASGVPPVDALILRPYLRRFLLKRNAEIKQRAECVSPST